MSETQRDDVIDLMNRLQASEQASQAAEERVENLKRGMTKVCRMQREAIDAKEQAEAKLREIGKAEAAGWKYVADHDYQLTISFSNEEDTKAAYATIQRLMTNESQS